MKLKKTALLFAVTAMSIMGYQKNVLIETPTGNT